MERVDIRKIDLDNTCFHFTLAENLESISKNGLVPKIGDNAKGFEHQPKIFFAKGKDAAVEILNVWIRWLIVCKIQRKTYYQSTKTPQEWLAAREKFYADVISGKVYANEAKMKAFEMFYRFCKDSSYLALDLKENVDYDPNDIDEVKLNNNRELVEAMYGHLTENEQNPFCMERWNMQTKIGRSVSPDKICQLSINGETDLLNMAKYLRERTNDVFVPLLDEFLEYSKNKDKKQRTGACEEKTEPKC